MLLFVKKNIKPIFIILIFFSLFSFSFLFFIQPSLAQVKDAIAIRVMKNLDHLSPARWYMEKVPNPGNPRSIQVDGYEAVRDGRTVYVSAASVNTTSNKIYTNIYIMSYNKDAKESTVKIFNQLVKNWGFNINIENLGICDLPDPDGNNINCSDDFDCVGGAGDYCKSDKNKIRRDVKRLADLEDIKKDLTDYSQKTGSFPGLPQGTYVSRISTSKWPSWQKELSAKIGAGISIDPINRFSGDCDLAGYDSGTCWNETAKEFKCDPGAYIYQYSSLGICSLHCDSANPASSTLCRINSDCPCNQGSAGTLPECQGFINQEYCIKSSAAVGISLNLESESDPMLYSFDMPSSGADPVCPSSQIYGTLNLESISCCEPMSCSSLGYTCGTYKNSCGQTIDCGTCVAPKQCINGNCCDPSCAGKECGDDSCGRSCGTCDSGYSCNSAFQCVHKCVDECNKKGETRCASSTNPLRLTADGRIRIEYCGYYDTDPCLEWSPTPEDCEWPNSCYKDEDPNICDKHCGDGIWQAIFEEKCDIFDNIAVSPADSSITKQYACDNNCAYEGGYCGDSIWQGAYGELCDGHTNCSSDCVCDIGWAACDSSAADADGCECDISGSNVCWFNICCTPTTCADHPTWCDDHSDGCGTLINCGVPIAPNTECSAGNIACVAGWADCNGSGDGSDADGCECDISGSNKCWNSACCTPDTCAADWCGKYDDSCGGEIECGAGWNQINNNYNASCKNLLDNDGSLFGNDGIYSIDPEDDGIVFSVYCDMTTDGGGWTLYGNVISSGFNYPSITSSQLGMDNPGINYFTAKPAGTQRRVKLEGSDWHFDAKEDLYSCLIDPNDPKVTPTTKGTNFFYGITGSGMTTISNNSASFNSLVISGYKYLYRTICAPFNQYNEFVVTAIGNINSQIYSIPPNYKLVALIVSEHCYNCKNSMNACIWDGGFNNMATGEFFTRISLWYR